MDNYTYVVYSEEYYFSMNTMSTILRKKVYSVSYNEASVEEVKSMMEGVLEGTLTEVNNRGELLTTYDIKVVKLDGKYSIDEAKKMVIDDDYTWGKVGKGKK